METRLETITPVNAEALLQRNPKNRILSRPRVNTIADAINRGEWKANGETIIIDSNGDLVSGQHRLHAVIKTGKSIQTLVVRGVDPEVRETVDLGRRRSASDMLVMRGEHNATTLAATIRVLDALRHEDMSRISQKLSPIAQAARLGAEPMVRDVVARVMKFRRKGGAAGVLAAVMTMASDTMPVAAAEYIESLTTGAGLKAGSSILEYRERIGTWGADNSSVPRECYFAITCWNQHCDPRTRKEFVRVSQTPILPRITGARYLGSF